MKYIISEKQYKKLIESKTAKKITDQIIEEVERAKKTLNENIAANAVVDIFKKYSKKGLLNKIVVEQLKENYLGELVKAQIIKE
jgi:hypothetical protein